jgi:drug/metabolite transporter (DMT)-like permease
VPDLPSSSSSDARRRQPADDLAAGVSLVAISAIAFGTLGIFGKLGARAGLTLPLLLALRFGVAAVLLSAGLAVRHRIRRPPLRTAAAVALMGTLYAGQAACYFGSLRTVPAAVTSVLLYTYPVIVTVVARVLVREPLSRVRVGALVGAMAGVVIIVNPFIGATRLDGAGVLLGVGSAFVYSTYILCGSVLLRSVDPVAATAGISAVAGGIFAVVSAVTGEVRPFQAAGWLVVAGLAVVPTMLAASAFLAGLRRVGPSRAATISTLEPASTALLALAVLGESLAAWRWAGGALVVLSAALLARSAVTGRARVMAHTPVDTTS